MRTLIQLECGECKRRNYATSKNKTKMTGKFEIKKFCRFCRKHTVHKEAK